MPDFVYDALTLPYPKANLAGLPPGANPAEWVVDSDWNRAMQAALDLRAAILAGRFFGYLPQGVAPGPVGGTYIWIDSGLRVLLRLADGTDRVLHQGLPGAITTSDALGQTRDILAYTPAGDGEAVNLRTRLSTIRDTAGVSVAFELSGSFRRAAGVVVQDGITLVTRLPGVLGPPSADYAIVGAAVYARVTGVVAEVYSWQADSFVVRAA